MENRTCLECGSDNIFVEVKPSDDGDPIYRCFDCYCESYEQYMNDED
jgi:transposase-like protein